MPNTKLSSIIGDSTYDLNNRTSVLELNNSPTVAPTANKVCLRDANGRSQMNDPAVNSDISTKNYVDNVAGTNLATSSVLMRRDGSGRAKVVDPAVSTDIATKNYVDTEI